jgi:hypothetical protein
MEKEQENSGLSDDATEASHFLLAKLEQSQTDKIASRNAYVCFVPPNFASEVCVSDTSYLMR